jgi:hypothetical protein
MTDSVLRTLWGWLSFGMVSRVVIDLKTEAVFTSETPVNLWETTRSKDRTQSSSYPQSWESGISYWKTDTPRGSWLHCGRLRTYDMLQEPAQLAADLVQYSTDYPTFGVSTFRFIRRVLLGWLTVTIVNFARSGMNHTPPPRTFYICMYSVALMFRHWCDPAVKRRKAAQKQTPITTFFKKLTPSFNSLHYVKHYFCLWDLSFVGVSYFPPRK